MSDTPISDSTPHHVADLGMQIRRIERQLNAANDRIKRLKEAGDAMFLRSTRVGREFWTKAKEDKL